jgi:Gas vesicle protein K
VSENRIKHVSENSTAKNSRKTVVREEATSVPSRIELSPENIEQGLAKLVLTLIDFLRQLLERQAIRRMEGGALSDQEIEQMGEALMKLEAKIQELADQFGLSPADLNIDLGPLGRLR